MPMHASQALAHALAHALATRKCPDSATSPLSLSLSLSSHFALWPPNGWAGVVCFWRPSPPALSCVVRSSQAMHSLGKGLSPPPANSLRHGEKAGRRYALGGGGKRYLCALGTPLSVTACLCRLGSISTCCWPGLAARPPGSPASQTSLVLLGTTASLPVVVFPSPIPSPPARPSGPSGVRVHIHHTSPRYRHNGPAAAFPRVGAT